MQVILDWDHSTKPDWLGCELPSLITTVADECTVQPLSCDGSVAFGDVLVATGTGRVAPDPVAGNRVPAVNLWVRVQLRGVHLLGASESCNTDAWLTVWEKELHFSDDSQHLLRVVEMSQAQKQHARHAKVCIMAEHADLYLGFTATSAIAFTFAICCCARIRCRKPWCRSPP